MVKSSGEIQKTDQPSRRLRELQLAQRLELDLADPFLGNAEHLAQVLEGMAPAVDEAIAKADDFPLATTQPLQGFVIRDFKRS